MVRPQCPISVHDRDEADAALLDGSHKYTLHFNADEIPPTLPNGFWSMTMYGADFQLVKKTINRFSIGDRTPDLTKNPDGSIDIYIQNQKSAEHASNWLPAPASGQFRLTTGSTYPKAMPKIPQPSERTYPRSSEPTDRSPEAPEDDGA
jgi:hypothetical protein